MDDRAIRLHITYDKPLEVKQFAKLLDLTGEAFSCTYDDISVQYKDVDLPPKTPATILKVGEGSILLELFSSALVSIASSVVASILADALKEKLGLGNKTQGVTISADHSTINIHIDEHGSIVRHRAWNADEESFFVGRAVDTYVIEKKICVDPEEFIQGKEFAGLVNRHGLNSLRLKLRNIKAIFEDLYVNNGLDVERLDHYSKRNEALVRKALKR